MIWHESHKVMYREGQISVCAWCLVQPWHVASSFPCKETYRPKRTAYIEAGVYVGLANGLGTELTVPGYRRIMVDGRFSLKYGEFRFDTLTGPVVAERLAFYVHYSDLGWPTAPYREYNLRDSLQSYRESIDSITIRINESISTLLRASFHELNRKAV